MSMQPRTSRAAVMGVAALLVAATCGRPPDPDAERAEVERVVRASVTWALDKDKDLLFRVLAHDDDFFIFHPDSASTITSWAEFEQLTDRVFMNPSFRAVRSELRDLHIGISRAGDAAWFHTYLDDVGEWDGRETAWLNARWTGALEKREDGWRIVQMHFSLPTERRE